MQNLNNLLKILLDNKIDFMIVGGFAAVVHGSSYVTKDLDISMALTDESLNKLRLALKDYNPIHRMNPSHKPSFLDEPKDFANIKNIYLETSLGILDVVSIDEALGSYSDLYARALEISLFGHRCKVMSLDDLIEVKKRLNRPKDRIVLEELISIKKDQKN